MPQLALFESTNTIGQFGLWATDGTAANTLELTGITGVSANGLSPTDLTVFNAEVLFNGTDTNGQNGLWLTDGTAAGTHELTGIVGANSNGLAPFELTVFNSEVLFEGTDTTGQYGLWVTDGTAAGTHELTGIVGANIVQGLWPSNITVFNGAVLFNGYDASGQYGLWVSNGTAPGTYELTGIIGANSNGLTPSSMTVLNSEVLFNGADTNGQNGLWVTNGTAAGTQELTGIIGTSTSGFGLNPADMTPFNGKVLFNGTDTNGQIGLWVTNGTAAGTHELAGITGASANGLSPSELTVINGEVLFSGSDANGQIGLWVTDGTAAGTHELTGITGASADGLSPSELTIFNGEVLFSGVDASGQYGLWETDGTAAGTHELLGISTANSSVASPADIISFTLATTNNAINDLITELYVGYYNRAPDPGGETYWAGQLQGGMSLSQIAQSYSVQTESTTLYPFLASPNTASTAAVQAFVTSVYENLFNRAPDTVGENYWVTQLQTGASTVGGAIINIISGAQGNDLVTISNKVTVGDYFDTQIFNNNVQYSNSVAHAAMSAVTSNTPSVATAEAIVDTYVKTAPLASAAASQADVSLVGILTSHDGGIAG